MMEQAARPVVIVDYDARWPLLYEEEKRRILRVTYGLIVAIEHIGSTAVIGLGAKPIIDIMAGLNSLDDAEKCIAPLEGIGYEFVPKNDLPERHFFRKGAWRAGTHHLHLVEQGSAFWEWHILFRDFLRASPDEAARYEKLKRELESKFGLRRDEYCEAKTPFIKEVIRKARNKSAVHS